MTNYKLLEKLLGSKFCEECGKTLKIVEDNAVCKCGMEYELKYRDTKRNKDKKTLRTHGQDI